MTGRTTEPTTQEQRDKRRADIKLMRGLRLPVPDFNWEHRLMDDVEALITKRDVVLSPKPESYACQQCGRRDGLDAAVTDEVWGQLTGRTNGLLCLWCMDKLATEKGIRAFVHLYFNGYSLVGSEGPTIWDESELTEQLLATETRCVQAVAERRAALEALRGTENAMDMLNGDWGKADRPCCFCRTRDYNGQVGIIHDDACPIAKARALLAHHGAEEEAG